MYLYFAANFLWLTFSLFAVESSGDFTHTIHINALQEDINKQYSGRFKLFVAQIKALSSAQQINKLEHFPFQPFRTIAMQNRQQELRHFHKTVAILDGLAYFAGFSGLLVGIPSSVSCYEPGIDFSDNVLPVCFGLAMTSGLLTVFEEKLSPSQRILNALATLQKIYNDAKKNNRSS